MGKHSLMQPSNDLRTHQAPDAGHEMGRYQYTKLDHQLQEIRIVELLPGNRGEPLRARIIHAPLREPAITKGHLLTKDELQATVPHGWNVRRTLEGRYIFTRGSRTYPPYLTSWDHPVEGFDSALYASHCNDGEPTYEPRYEALSYVWGSEDSRQPLSIVDIAGRNGQSIECTLSIKQNLESALRHLRKASETRKLWIDAICINQRDVSERNEQVHRMGRIYSFAARVVIWVGEATGDSSLALSTIDYLGQQVEFSVDFFIIRHPNAKEMDWYVPGTSLPHDDHTYAALEHFFQRPWFERLWVFQEVVLANRHSIIQCGEDSVSWTSFRNGVTLISEKSLPSKTLERRLERITIPVGASTLSSRRLLGIASDRQCSDLRDKLYGMLSIAPSDLAAVVQPDYSQKPEDVFRNAFLSVSKLSRRLNWLSSASPSRNSSSLPSWVVNWADAPLGRGIFWDFSVSGCSRAEYQYIEPGTLRVTGVLVTSIKNVSDLMMNHPEQLWKLVSQEQALLNGMESYVTGEKMVDAFISALTLNTCSECYSHRLYPTRAKWKEFLLDTSESEERTRWLSIICKALDEQVFLKTASGHMGVGVSSAISGDVVVVLLGCESPLILRPKVSDKTRTTYTIVGTCYIHGLMFGEAILGPLPDGHIVQFTRDAFGAHDVMFQDGLGAVLNEDPRLGPLASEWERLPVMKTKNEAPPVAFRHRSKGEEVNSDPRLLPDDLRRRGVVLQTFDLV